MNRLQLMRYERGLTVEQLAELLGVSAKTVRRFEAGGRPRPATAHALAVLYGRSVGELLGLEPAEAK